MAIKDTIETMISFEYLRLLPPEKIYLFLKKNAENKDAEYSTQKIESLLHTLDQPLINLGLAQYGYNKDVLRNLYLNGNETLKIATLMNRKDNYHVVDTGNKSWVDREFIKKIVMGENENEKYALLTNPLIGATTLAELFEKKQSFDKVTEDIWKRLLEYCGDNILLQIQYDHHYYDGYTEFSFSNMHRLAWRLTEQVPITKEWSYTLSKLLVRAYPELDINLISTIEKWKLIDKDSVDIRMVLAAALNGDDFNRLKDSDDIDMRRIFYRKFYCKNCDELDSYFKKDKNVFLEEASFNKNLYREESIRFALRELTLKTEDSDLIFYNWVISEEKEIEKRYPEWFKDKNINDDSDEDDKQDSNALLKDAFKKLAKIHNLIFLTFILVLGIAIHFLV